jgi:hypothetical protein
MLKRVYIFLVFVAVGLGFAFSVHAERTSTATKTFVPSKTMLETAERMLNAEQDPQKRIELLFRWIKIKEETEQTRKLRGELQGSAETFLSVKTEILDRLIAEKSRLRRPGLRLERLHRELGYRLAEAKRYEEARENFELLPKLEDEESLAYGDVLVQLKEPKLALAAYEKPRASDQWKTLAAYRRAWALMALNDFENALMEFRAAMEENAHSPARLREEAFRDHLRPFVETHQEPLLSELELTLLRELAMKVRQVSDGSRNTLYEEALVQLIEIFNSKNQMEKAQQVYLHFKSQLPAGSQDAENVLVAAAPLWLRILRGKLEHEEIKSLVTSLPSRKLDAATSLELLGELQNSALFYETLRQDRKDQKFEEEWIEALLSQLYQKYFVLYPADPTADALRINYSRLLLKSGDAETCLSILKGRSGTEAEWAEAAQNLEARCDLKLIDQLYARPHDQRFYQKLSAALTTDKIYDRSDIGVTPAQAFQGLSGMLIGALQQKPSNEDLRAVLKSILGDYPSAMPGETKLSLEMLQAELSFNDIVQKGEKGEVAAAAFHELFVSAPPQSPVKVKSLTNSVLLSMDQKALARCDQGLEAYPSEFSHGSDVYRRCLYLADWHTDIEREDRYWRVYSSQLTDQEKIRLALVQKGLGRDSDARAWLKKVPAEEGTRFTLLWEAATPVAWAQRARFNPQAQNLVKKAEAWMNTLKPIKFAAVATRVPRVTQSYTQLDAEMLKATAALKGEGFSIGRILQARSEMAIKLRDWMLALPEPETTSPEELSAYRQSAQTFVAPWVEAAKQIQSECSRLAYPLSSALTESEFCPEDTSPHYREAEMKAWEASRQKEIIESPWEEKTLQRQLAQHLVKSAQKIEDNDRARYYFIRALHLFETPAEKASVHVLMAERSKKDFHWLAASELDGNLLSPRQFLLEGTKGNPFFQKLYQTQMNLIQRRESYAPLSASIER